MENNNIEKLNLNSYIIEQETLHRGKFYIKDGHGNDILFVESPRLAIWHTYKVYNTHKKEEHLFSIIQDRPSLFLLGYTVKDKNNKKVGQIKEKFSFYRKQWTIRDQMGKNIGKICHSIKTAAKRLVIGKETTEELIFLDNEEIGTIRWRFTLWNKFDLDLYNDPEKRLDRRLALAAAIILHLSYSKGFGTDYD